MTHFSDADSARGIAHQLRAFEQATQDLLGERCIANSAAILRHGGAAEVAPGLGAPGIVVYGSAPDHPSARPPPGTCSRHDPGLAPHRRAAAAGRRQRGLWLALHCRWPLRIGVVACGYADGYPRHADTGTPVLVAACARAPWAASAWT